MSLIKLDSWICASLALPSCRANVWLVPSLFASIHLHLHYQAMGGSILGHLGRYIWQALTLLQNTKEIAVARLVCPDYGLLGALSRSQVSDKLVRVKSLIKST